MKKRSHQWRAQQSNTGANEWKSEKQMTEKYFPCSFPRLLSSNWSLLLHISRRLISPFLSSTSISFLSSSPTLSLSSPPLSSSQNHFQDSSLLHIVYITSLPPPPTTLSKEICFLITKWQISPADLLLLHPARPVPWPGPFWNGFGALLLPSDSVSGKLRNGILWKYGCENERKRVE